jgi:AbiV family abortive infection protein
VSREQSPQEPATRITPSAAELAAFGDAAFRNATELAEEAALLAAHGHFARAYFLAVASIEETGKAIILFEAQGRDLKNPAVFSRLIRAWSDHGEKITSAFMPWFAADPEAIRTRVMPLTNLMVALRNGREPAMYSDIRSDNQRPQLPSEVVRESAAKDCVRLAADCLANARQHLKNNSPTQYSAEQDKLFALKRAHYHRIMNTPDFWWYYLAEMEAGRKDFAVAIMSYREQFELIKKKNRKEEPS